MPPCIPFSRVPTPVGWLVVIVRSVVARKNKTNKSITKRLKSTATGKLKHGIPGRRHLNAHMTAKRRRQLRRAGIITGALVKKYLIAMNQY